MVTTQIPPIVEQHDEEPFHERRREWHTPQDCYKLLATQEMVTGLQKSVTELQRSVTGINTRLDSGQGRMDRIETNISTINSIISEGAQTHTRLEEKIDQGNADNQELLKIVRSAKGFFTVAGWLATAVKWVIAIALSGIALYTAIKGLDK